MRRIRRCEQIIEEHYAAVLRFCKARLWNDDDGASECTQEVFLLLLRKADELDLDGQIGNWLIAAASRITKKYLREKAERAAAETGGVDELPDSAAEAAPRSPVFAALTDAEYTLLLRYYAADSPEREALAAELGISVNALYQRIHSIKSKLRI